jgi:hypothetical protein
MLNRYLSIVLVCTFLGNLLPASWAFSAETPSTESSSVSIDISGLTSFLATLPPDEKDEQLRDWALYGLMNNLGLTPQEDIPVRHPSLKDSHPGEVSLGRVFPLSAKEWGVLVSRDLLKNKPVLGGLIDKKYASTNTLPEKVSFYSYSPGLSEQTIHITCEGSIDTRELFTPAYGYCESTIDNLADFTSFIQKIDDIVMVQWRRKTLVLGGRKYQQGSGRSLTVENIAALYQAYTFSEKNLTQGKYEAFVQEKYDERVRSDKKLLQGLRTGRINKAQIFGEIRSEVPFTLWMNRNQYVGFSLEPDIDYAALADDIDQFAKITMRRLPVEQAANAGRESSLIAEFKAAAEQIRIQRDMKPYLALRWRFKESGSLAGKQINDVLQDMEARRTFQVAQYYGRLQGTSVGMILFYTDLLAKLWALDYNNIAPKGTIRGFRTPQEISISKLHWDDFEKFSQTRLWFGLQQEAFDVYGDKVLLQPVATRIYAASADPITPGEESPPNYQSGEFLGWLDRHFETVAAYEPYYHKLNQIQKWSCIFMLLKEKKSPILDFLLPVTVAQDLDFETWSKQAVKTNVKIDIPFLDRRKYGRSSECLPPLRSKIFRVLGEATVLSGGVSLASPKDILAKLNEHDKTAVPMQHVSSTHPREDLLPIGSSKDRHTLSSGGQPSAIPATSQTQISTSLKSSTTTVTLPRLPTGSSLLLPDGTKLQVSEGAYGTFSAEKQQGQIKLEWHKGPLVVMSDLVNALATLQQSNVPGSMDEGIFSSFPELQSVVRVKEWHTYLIKTAAIKDGWIYLSMNPAQLADYPAMAAGAFPNADIFCARLVDADYARELAAGKEIIK